MNITDFAGRAPELRLETYFARPLRAWGLFEDRFGRVRKEFTIDMAGSWDGHELVLAETFHYTDGGTDSRQWRFRKDGPTGWRGTAPDVVGEAVGQVAGNVLNLRYVLDMKVAGRFWRVRFDDWMFLQPDGTILNRAYVRRWGFAIGSLSVAFRPTSCTVGSFV